MLSSDLQHNFQVNLKKENLLRFHLPFFSFCITHSSINAFFYFRKKLKTTTDYIYQVLYVEGENSDITINALGKAWNLHKLYLKQVNDDDVEV